MPQVTPDTYCKLKEKATIRGLSRWPSPWTNTGAFCRETNQASAQEGQKGSQSTAAIRLAHRVPVGPPGSVLTWAVQEGSFWGSSEPSVRMMAAPAGRAAPGMSSGATGPDHQVWGCREVRGAGNMQGSRVRCRQKTALPSHGSRWPVCSLDVCHVPGPQAMVPWSETGVPSGSHSRV